MTTINGWMIMIYHLLLFSLPELIVGSKDEDGDDDEEEDEDKDEKKE